MLGDVRRLPDDGDRAFERTVRLTFVRDHLADVVLAVIAIEFVLLVTRGGWSARAAALRLGPALLMMLALRAALTGAAWQWVALLLALSFPIHLADLRRR